MLYQQDISACLAEQGGPGGLDPDRLEALIAKAKGAVEGLRRRHADAGLPLLVLPSRRDDLRALGAIAERLKREFRAVVVLGTGGSSLGAQALCALAPRGAEPRLHFPDNLDGHDFGDLLGVLEPGQTVFLVISKSGGTAETLAQALAAIAWLKAALGDDGVSGHLLAITEPGDNALRRLAEHWRFAGLDHDPNLGGRFSVLSLVGLLPALAAGLDAAAVRRGAAEVLEQVLQDDRAPPVLGAAVQVGLAARHGVTGTVTLGYDSRLERLAHWHRQLWAESLGKNGAGLTPIAALGPVDHHSQLQLWLDGPADKFFTAITIDDPAPGPVIDTGLGGNDPALAYLDGRSFATIVQAQARATAETLTTRGRPVRRIALARLDERGLGALFMHYMLETIVAAHLMGVNPFDQPAVEDAKVLTRRYLEP